MSLCAGDAVVAYPLFQGGKGGSTPTPALSSPKSLWFSVLDQDRASSLNRGWHSRFPELGGGGSRVCYAAEHGHQWYAVAVWTNPTSPKLPQLAWLLLKRFAVARSAPRYTAGRMMGWMIRDVRGRFPGVETLVSYSDPDTHDGTIYRATGWIKDRETIRRPDRAGWHNRGRQHTANAPCRRVVRWLYFTDPVKHAAEKEKRTARLRGAATEV